MLIFEKINIYVLEKALDAPSNKCRQMVLINLLIAVKVFSSLYLEQIWGFDIEPYQ